MRIIKQTPNDYQKEAFVKVAEGNAGIAKATLGSDARSLSTSLPGHLRN